MIAVYALHLYNEFYNLSITEVTVVLSACCAEGLGACVRARDQEDFRSIGSYRANDDHLMYGARVFRRFPEKSLSWRKMCV